MLLPPSVVRNEITSTPDVVRDGATSDGHLIAEANVVVCAPPFVTIRVTVPALPDAGGFEKLNSYLQQLQSEQFHFEN